MIVSIFSVALLNSNTAGQPKIIDPPSPNKGVLLLSFDGYYPVKQVWGRYDSIGPTSLSDSSRTIIINDVKEYFKDFDVVVTTDSKLFYTYPQNKRARACITDDKYYFYFQIEIPGFTKYNALFLNDSTPSIISVTSETLVGNLRNISGGVAHEVGHLLGVGHQATWENAEMIEEYALGDSAFAPIMGMFYKAKSIGWTIGINSNGQYQNDKKVIGETWTQLRK
jgi:hypothetical protein